MPTMPNVVGLQIPGSAEASLKSAGVLVPLSLGYFGGGTLRTQQGTFQGAAATWPISVTWVNQETASSNVDGNLKPTFPGQVLTQNPPVGTTMAANDPVQLTAVQPAVSVSYPGTNLTNGLL